MVPQEVEFRDFQEEVRIQRMEWYQSADAEADRLVRMFRPCPEYTPPPDYVDPPEYYVLPDYVDSV